MKFNSQTIDKIIQNEVFSNEFVMPELLAITGYYYIYSSNYQENTRDYLLESFAPLLYKSKSDELEIKNGASKIVIIPDSDDDEFVIKIPCTGYYTNGYNFADKCSEVKKDEENFRNFFETAIRGYIVKMPEQWLQEEEDFREYSSSDEIISFDSSDLDNCRYYLNFNQIPLEAKNYCEVEYLIYNEMKKLKLDCFFAGIRKIENDNPKNQIYIQEKVLALSETESSLSSLYPNVKVHKWAKRAKSKVENTITFCFDEFWLEKAVMAYGKKKVKRFLKFLMKPKKSERKISKIISDDLHMGNYGFRMDGTPCLLDYSGYYG